MAIVGLATSARGADPSLTDPSLQVTTVVSGLSQPTGLAFLGNDDFLVVEKASGKVKRVTGGLVTSTVLDLPVNFSNERGLLGIALHPAFPINPGVYLFWSESSTGSDSGGVTEVGNSSSLFPPSTPQPLGNRVDRFTWDATSQTLVHDHNLIRLRALQNDDNSPSPLTGSHNGGQIRFGPDGKIYIQIGDVGRRGWLQNLPDGPWLPPAADDPFGGPAPDNNHLAGVILRLNDDGATPTDNPFFVAGAAMGGEVGANIQRLFSYGHRNHFGLAFDPESGNLWNVENGDDSFDEINKIVPGGNYGWIQVMGPLRRIAQFKRIELNIFDPASAKAGSLYQVRYPPTRIASSFVLAKVRMYNLPGSVYQDPEMSWRYTVPPSGVGFVNGNGLGANYAGTMWTGAARTNSVSGGRTGTFEGGFLMVFRLNTDRSHLDLSADRALADRVADNGKYPPPRGTSPGTTGYKFDGRESESLLVGRNFGVSTDIQTGPDGYLYVLSFTNGSIYRISLAASP